MEPDPLENPASDGYESHPNAVKRPVSDLLIGVLKIVAGILWFYCVLGIVIVGITQMSGKYPIFGALCLAFALILFVSGLYWTSPRFKSQRVIRSFADFRVWVGESSRATWETTTSLFKLLGWFAVAGICVALVVGGYQQIDKTGWISHDHDTPVWISGNWMVGEYRNCGMLTTTPPLGVTMSQQTRAELPRLFCGKNWDGEGIVEFQLAMPNYSEATDAVWDRADWSEFEGYFHTLPVHYYGRIKRPDTVYDSWRCQRLSYSLECKALN